jgi:hypothetical protein
MEWLVLLWRLQEGRADMVDLTWMLLVVNEDQINGAVTALVSDQAASSYDSSLLLAVSLFDFCQIDFVASL